MISKERLAVLHDLGHGTYFPGPCTECEELLQMPNPDNIELEAAKENLIQLQHQNDRLHRRIHLLETLLSEMLNDRLKNPPRRRTAKQPTAATAAQ